MNFCQECRAPLEVAPTEDQTRATSKPAKAHLKKSTKIMAIFFSVIVVVSVIFISVNPLQFQTELDTSLGDDTQEDISSINDDNEQESNDFEYGEVDSLKTEVTDANGVTGIQIGDAEPVMDMAENARIGFTNEDLLREYRGSARTFYHDFRNDYQNALNTGDFDHVSNYFEDGSATKQNYEGFVLKHRDWDFDYSYTFLSNTTELEATSANTIVVTAHEIFELYKQDSNPKTSKNERKKRYTLKLIGNSFYISNVENVDGSTPAKANTNSTNVESKSAYMASIQYAENLVNNAYSASGTSGDFKRNLWDAYEAWDDELNRIYGLLKEKLPPQKMEVLKKEQRAWIKARDKQTDPTVVGYLTQIEILNDLAKERTLYLIDMYFDEE